MAPGVVLGVIGGALIAKISSRSGLQWVWVVSATVMALRLLLARDDWRLGDALPGLAARTVYGAVVGLLSALMSVGGASFMVAFLALYGRPLLPSISTSSGLGPLIAIPGTLGFIWAGWGAPGLPPFSFGFISLIGAALVIPVSVYAAPIGVRMAHGLPKQKLEIAFAAFLGLMSLRFFIAAAFE